MYKPVYTRIYICFRNCHCTSTQKITLDHFSFVLTVNVYQYTLEKSIHFSQYGFDLRKEKTVQKKTSWCLHKKHVEIICRIILFIEYLHFFPILNHKAHPGKAYSINPFTLGGEFFLQTVKIVGFQTLMTSVKVPPGTGGWCRFFPAHWPSV